jgi:8-oxo-dGTP diphosphatase
MYRYDYPRPSVTVDMIVFTVSGGTLRVLLVQRGGEPFKAAWAIPGGFVHVDEPVGGGESLDQAASRELVEETGLDRADVYLEQLYTFGSPERDLRGRVILVAYMALVSAHLLPKVRAGSDAADVRWFDVVNGLPEPLAFDHAEILEVVLTRLRGKVDYEPRVALGLVPQEFTQAELRRVLEAVHGRPLDRGNFSKRFTRLREDGVVVGAQGYRELPSSGRPPKLFRFGGD